MMERMEKIKKLKEFFLMAKKKGHWIYCRYTGEWYTPEQMSKEVDEGRFIWLVDEFEIKNPLERVQELQKEVRSAKLNLRYFIEKMKQYKEGK